MRPWGQSQAADEPGMLIQTPHFSTQGDYSETTLIICRLKLGTNKNHTHLSFASCIFETDKVFLLIHRQRSFSSDKLACVRVCACTCMHTHKHTCVFGIIAVIDPDIYFTKLLWWCLPPTRYEERTWPIQWGIVAPTLYLQLCRCLSVSVFVCWKEYSDSQVPDAAPRTEGLLIACEQGQCSAKSGNVVTQCLEWISTVVSYLSACISTFERLSFLLHQACFHLAPLKHVFVFFF